MTKLSQSLLLLAVGTAFMVTTALSQQFPGEILDVDETGQFAILHPPQGGVGIIGFINPTIGQDPVSGMFTLCFPLQAAGISTTEGDVLLFEPGRQNFSDIIRFVGGNMYFFSEFEPGEPNPDPADVGLPPLWVNVVLLDEIGPEGNNSAFYHPAPGQPGFTDPTGPVPGMSYNFISDVPEPDSMALLLSGAGICAWKRLRRENRSTV